MAVGRQLRLEVGPETTTSVLFDKHSYSRPAGLEGLVELVNKTVRHFFSPNTSSMFHRDSLCCNSNETELCVSSGGDKTWPPVTLGETSDSLRLGFLIYTVEIRVIVFMTWSHGFPEVIKSFTRDPNVTGHTAAMIIYRSSQNAE